MKKLAMISEGLVLAGVLFAAAGCSSSTSSSDSTPKIDGMTPAEYREKGEQRGKPAAPATQSKGRSRTP
jgi:hypothetical protein